ncbi:MAG TPA: hypothetical protein VFV50_08815 [Bdellovibrionales bacterium]|nr:hypothetical protein [Bdellovibrionales bacterium]
MNTVRKLKERLESGPAPHVVPAPGRHEESVVDVIDRCRRNMAVIETMIAKLGFLLKEIDGATASRNARRTHELDWD